MLHFQRSAAVVMLLLASGCALFGGSGGHVTGRPTVDGLLLAEDSPRFLVCGHRGDFFGSLFAEGFNTIESMERARRNGADMVEVDVQATRDRVPVIAHGGEPGKRTLAEWEGAGEPPLLLADVLLWAAGRIVVVLDLKTRDTAAVVAAVRAASAETFSIFSASNRGEYERVRFGGSDLYVMARARRAKDVGVWLGLCDPMLVLVHGDHDWLTRQIVDDVRCTGRRTFANSYRASWHAELFGAGGSAGRLFAEGIDVVQTNHPGGASEARDEALRESR